MNADQDRLKEPPSVSIRLKPPADGHPGYIGAFSSFPARESEDWRRGNDLADGPFTEETIDRIARDLKEILAYLSRSDSALN